MALRRQDSLEDFPMPSPSLSDASDSCDVEDEDDSGNIGSSAYDLQLVTRHTYLGEVEDVATTGSGVGLEAGHKCRLPFLPLSGIVVFPGATIPLRLVEHGQLEATRHALKAGPHCGLMAVGLWNMVASQRVAEGKMVACTTKIRQARVVEDGTINCVATGRQRCQVVKVLGDHYAEVEILPEDNLAPAPRAIKDELGYWGSWAYKAFDPGPLARLACTAYAHIAPRVQLAKGDPHTLAFWLAANAPLHHVHRQRLLAMDSTSDRLRFLIKLLRKMQGLCCCNCGAPIASPKDMLAMSEAGSGGVFVNLYGYSHDVVTLQRVRGIALEGRPETEQSWFPGFAWTICRCSSCFLHLGWRFTAVQEGLSPHTFWGLRPQCLRSQGDGPAHNTQHQIFAE